MARTTETKQSPQLMTAAEWDALLAVSAETAATQKRQAANLRARLATRIAALEAR